MIKKPKISVIMPVYNSERHLKLAVSSVLKQSFKNFEFIIINDGSTDKTSKILKTFKDKRIIVFNNPRNLGVTRSLNIGLKVAKGDFIARADADDVNNPSRFSKQISFLEKNPEYVLAGSQISLINEYGKKINGKIVLPKNDKDIRKKMFIRNPIAHPSVLMRRGNLVENGGYREIFNGVEDYDLWLRLSQKGKLHNLSEVLVLRRISDDAITQKKHLEIELKGLIVRVVNFLSQFKNF